MESSFEKVIDITGTKSKILSSYCFYEYLLPEISAYAHSEDRKYKSLILDFRGIKEIDPLVLPNLFTVGMGLKRKYISPIRIRNLNGQIYQTLKNSGFVEQAEREEVFYFCDKDAYYDPNDKLYDIGKNLFLYYECPTNFKNYKENEFENNPRLYQSVVNYVYDIIQESDSCQNSRTGASGGSASTPARKTRRTASSRAG